MITEIRCSKLARPMVCAGFLSFENLPEDQPNEAAKEGTAAGEWLARKLISRGGEFLEGAQSSNGVYFDNDMKFYLTPILDEILSKAEEKILCEQRIDWQTRSSIWIKGSYDISFIHDGNLYIDDLKYGWGIVEVENNWQLLGYAIGEVIRRGIAFPKIILRIHQPRPHHELGTTREWILTYDQLLGYKEKIELRMDEIANGFRQLQTGKQCKYCQAAPEACPAFSKLFYRALEVTHEFVQDQISDDELGRQLDHAQRAVEVIKTKLDSLNELGISRIKRGCIIPGYLTEDRYSDRKWKDGTDPEMLKTLSKGKELVEKIMLSPAKAEKAGVPKDLVNAFVERRFLGQKLVKKDQGDFGDKIFGKGPPV